MNTHPLTTAVVCLLLGAASVSASPVTLSFDDGDGGTTGSIDVVDNVFPSAEAEFNNNVYEEAGYQIRLLDQTGALASEFLYGQFTTYNHLDVNGNTSTGLASFGSDGLTTLTFELTESDDRPFDLLAIDLAPFLFSQGEGYLGTNVEFEAFDSTGTSLGSQTASIQNSLPSGSNYVDENLITFNFDQTVFAEVASVRWNQGGLLRRHQFDNVSVQLNAVAVPEPSFAVLGVFGTAAAWIRRRRHQSDPA